MLRSICATVAAVTCPSPKLRSARFANVRALLTSAKTLEAGRRHGLSPSSGMRFSAEDGRRPE